MDLYDFINEDIDNLKIDLDNVNENDSDYGDVDNLAIDDTVHLLSERNFDGVDDSFTLFHHTSDYKDENIVHNHENDNHSSHLNNQISFTGYGACGVKGCPCGGYSSKDSGMVCRNCPHTFAQHN